MEAGRNRTILHASVVSWNLRNSATCRFASWSSRTLGGVPPHDELARRVSELAGGNPLLAEEIALMLKSEGLVAVREGFWRSLRPLDGVLYFEGVERVIRERVDRLDTTTQHVLKAAAVIGRSFTREALETLLGGGGPQRGGVGRSRMVSGGAYRAAGKCRVGELRISSRSNPRCRLWRDPRRPAPEASRRIGGLDRVGSVGC